MPYRLKLIPDKTDNPCSDFNWINIERGSKRVGKIRARIANSTLTIFSISIFPEFERNGYARKALDIFKKACERIVADRVRYTAVGFWLKMGFVRIDPNRYVYERGGISRLSLNISSKGQKPNPKLDDFIPTQQ